MRRGALEHIVIRDGGASYERADDDRLCALCDSRAVEDLALPVSSRPIPVCRRHLFRLRGLAWWPRRLKVHLAPPKKGWLYLGPVMVWCEGPDRTLCGRSFGAVRVSGDGAEVTCGGCLRSLEALARPRGKWDERCRSWIARRTA